MSDGSNHNPRFHAVRNWIFDLDNTLYPPSANLFAQIDVRMNTFISRELGVASDEASDLRRRYWHEHGTTMEGLRLHHGISPEAFLAEAHAIDYSVLRQDPGLASEIARLPGRKIIHTNGPRCHAGAVLKALGYLELFDDVFALEDAGLVSKPHADAFRAVYEAAEIEPSESAMIEDDARNLLVPHSQSVQTIWLDHNDQSAAPEHVGHHIGDLKVFLAGIEPA